MIIDSFDWFIPYWILVQYSTLLLSCGIYNTEQKLFFAMHWMRDWRLDSLDSLTRHDSPKSQSHARMHEWIDNNHNLITLSTIDDRRLLIVDCWLLITREGDKSPKTLNISSPPRRTELCVGIDAGHIFTFEMSGRIIVLWRAGQQGAERSVFSFCCPFQSLNDPFLQHDTIDHVNTTPLQ